MLEILDGIINIIVNADFLPERGLAQAYRSSPAPDVFHTIKIISYIITPILGFLIFVVIRSFLKLKSQMAIATAAPEISETPSAGGALGARWAEISKHIESINEGEWKFAVIEADKLVDDTLKSSGFPGETMGERLMNMDKTQIVTLDGLWDAHKTRNRLVHDSNYFLRYAEAKRAVRLYEETLKELGAL